jgi:hypothetical protein
MFGGGALTELLKILDPASQVLDLLAKRGAFFDPQAMFFGQGELEVRPTQRLARRYVPKVSEMRKPFTRRGNVSG